MLEILRNIWVYPAWANIKGIFVEERMFKNQKAVFLYHLIYSKLSFYFLLKVHIYIAQHMIRLEVTFLIALRFVNVLSESKLSAL